MNSKFPLVLFHTLLILCTAASANPHNTDFPPLDVYGEIKHNACLPERKQSMLKRLPEDARGLVDTLLCVKKTEASKTYLLRHMRKFIKSTTLDEKYNERTRVIKAGPELAEELLSAGEAWDVNLEVTADRIQLNFMPNEVCHSRRNLIRLKGKWWIDETDDACD